VLEDGSVFEGEAVGYIPENGIAAGEVVFHTALTGYQEVFTDPSYAGQIITFTTSHIGNYGVTPIDSESRGTFARGVIMRDMARRHSNWRSESSLDAMLKAQKLPGVAGLDTRRLTRLLRDSGSLRGAFGTADQAQLLAAAKNEKGTSGIDLVSEVTTPKAYTVGDGKFNVIAYDFGIKTTILRHLSEIATVTVVPASKQACQLSVSVSDISCCLARSVGTHSSCLLDTTAPIIPSATSQPDQLRSLARTTTSASTLILCRELQTLHTSISMTSPTKECACATIARSVCSITLKRGLVHTTVTIYSDNSQNSWTKNNASPQRSTHNSYYWIRPNCHWSSM
jgi:hypothetical protein